MLKAPFPYFGGKTPVANKVWRALGQPDHYIEPFCGSCAVLLLRPGWHPRMTETVNDADGFIANVWRSLQFNPDEVAKWCDWPVNHADLIARKRMLILNHERLLENLCKDDKWHDPLLAGYYIWAASCWMGYGLTSSKQIPHIGTAGMGVHSKGQIPHIGTTGMGVQEPYNVEIYKWFRQLSERLRNVRVVCGDWTRVCGGNWQDDLGICGMFFDPPYSDVANRTDGIYTVDSKHVAHDVHKWCLERGTNKKYRIVLAGYYEEHESLLEHGWTVYKWKAQGGYANTAQQKVTQGKINRYKEALFFSPRCIQRYKDLWGK